MDVTNISYKILSLVKKQARGKLFQSTLSQYLSLHDHYFPYSKDRAEENSSIGTCISKDRRTYTKLRKNCEGMNKASIKRKILQLTWVMTILRKLGLVSAKIGDSPIPAVIEGQLEVIQNGVYVAIEDDSISGMGPCERKESAKRSLEEEKQSAKMEQGRQ